jgi:hypothetical protein
MPQRLVVALLFMGLLLGRSSAKDKPSKYETTVTADKGGTVVERQYLSDGDSHVRRLFTNYISYRFKGEGEMIHLTVTCTEDWRWNRCFALTAGASYHALFEFHSGHGDDFVQLTGQPGGNLTKPTTTKNRIVNFAAN